MIDHVFQRAGKSISGNGEYMTWVINPHDCSVPRTRVGTGDMMMSKNLISALQKLLI